jgi:hypothetical protein
MVLVGAFASGRRTMDCRHGDRAPVSRGRAVARGRQANSIATGQ